MSEGIGFPQLDASSYPSQVFWLGVAFVVLYTLMSKLALPRVTAVLDKRRNHRDGKLARAGEMGAEAEQIKTAYEASLAKAQQSAHDAMMSAEREIADKTAAAQARFADNARKRLVVAEQGIFKAKTAALNSLADIAAEIAADMVEKISGVQVAKTDAKKVVTSLMQKGS